MESNWPYAFAFAALCVSVACYNIFAPNAQTPKTPQLACIEQRGDWTPHPGTFSRSDTDGTCKFPTQIGAKP